MCSLKLFLVCALVALASSEDDAKPCDANACALPNCLCSGKIPTGNIPQLVALSFDDSTSKLISDEFYETELFTRKNPDGCPISGTFYVPHEYTDYTVVNNLYNHGFEIGSHSITGNADELFAWMVENFERNYNSGRAPVSLSINYAWFTFTDNSLNALQKFFDHLKTKKDVFVVSNSQVLNWIKNPVAADKFSSCQENRSASCKPVSCQLQNEDGDVRYMASCVPCPKNYPSLNNPLGTGTKG